MGLFFRIEKDSVGPYRHDDTYRLGLGGMVDDHGWDPDNNHPTPLEDDGIGYKFIPGVHTCGFTSRDRMNQWFEGYGAMLRNAGFSVCTYQVPDDKILKGEYQDAAAVRDLKSPVYETFPTFR